MSSSACSWASTIRSRCWSWRKCSAPNIGLGWYIQFQTAYSGYANVYATLVIMSLICAGIVKLLFVARDRLLGWQKGFI